MITQKQLKEILFYNPINGNFYWKDAWVVRIGYKNEVFHFGNYKDLDEAIKVRNEKIKLFDFTDRHGVE